MAIQVADPYLKFTVIFKFSHPYSAVFDPSERLRNFVYYSFINTFRALLAFLVHLWVRFSQLIVITFLIIYLVYLNNRDVLEINLDRLIIFC